jgi:modified peptide precursor CbpA
MNKIRKNNNKKSRNDVIASRKTCKTDGTGLSHYILVDKKAK